MPHETERRQEARAAIELKVEYQRLNAFFYDYTKNISKGGTFIKTKRPLDVGTRFVFQLLIPSIETPLTLGGEVRWVLREGDPIPADHGDDSHPGMGIRFLFDEDGARDILDKTVERMMLSSLGPLIYSRLREVLS